MTSVLRWTSLLIVLAAALAGALHVTGVLDLQAGVAKIVAGGRDPAADATPQDAQDETRFAAPSPSGPPQETELPGGPALPAVTVALVRAMDFRETVMVTGSIAPREEVLVAPEVEGLRVVALLAEEGDMVKKGQVLARLETETLKSELDQNTAAIARSAAAIQQARSQIAEAEARLAEATAQLERAAPLTQKGYVSESVYDTRQASKRTAEAQLASARSGVALAEADVLQLEAQRRNLEWRLSRTELVSPVSGFIARRKALVGDVAMSARDPLFRIVENAEIELEASVPESKLTWLAQGQAAMVVVAGEAAREATVRLVSPEVDKATRQGRVRLLIGNGAGLKVGAFGRAEITSGRSHGNGVPSAALLYVGGKTRVQLVRDGVVRTVDVETGLVAAGMTEITSGLSPGDVVIARAGTFLREGDKVRPILPATDVSEVR